MPEVSLVVRVYRGVADHFPIRLTEWAMLWPTFGLWLGLQLQPEMFATSRSFDALSSWLSESQWSIVMGAAMVCRFGALIINGTFKGFEFSPHIRAAASLVGIALWSQFSLGFLTAFLFNGGAISGFIGWSTMVLLEMFNLSRSLLDVGRQFPDRG